MTNQNTRSAPNALCNQWHWEPPEHWMKITTADLHSGGEPLRVCTAGLPAIVGDDVLAKRRYFREHCDYIRTGTRWEPRGHADMCITPSADADLDVFFLHNDGYSTMCGHAIIARTKFVIESSAVEGPGVSFNVPAGRIEATAAIKHGRVVRTVVRNMPSFLYRRDQVISVAGLGPVKFDIAYGGAFYAIVAAAPLGLCLDAANYSELIDAGREIKNAVTQAMPVEHPIEPDLSFLYGTIFMGAAREPMHHSRNVCIFAEGEMDRSATGSGVSARAALQHARGELGLNEEITIESILGNGMDASHLE